MNEELDRLKAENARLSAEKAEVISGASFALEQYSGVKKALALQGEEIDRLKAENARLAAALKAVLALTVESGSSTIVQTCAEAESCLQNSTTLRHLLAPTIELWETLSNSFKTGWAHSCESRHDVILLVEAIAKKELARLRGIVEGKS